MAMRGRRPWFAGAGACLTIILCAGSLGAGDVGTWLRLDGETHPTNDVGERISEVAAPRIRNGRQQLRRWEVGAGRDRADQPGPLDALAGGAIGPAVVPSEPTFIDGLPASVPRQPVCNLQTIIITI